MFSADIIISLSLFGFESYLLAQTTDSGSNNNTLASELETIFSESQDPVYWNSAANHVRCYTHKLGLVVNEGLKTLGIKNHQTKPTNPEGRALVIPEIYVNGEEEVDEGASSDDDDTNLDLHSHVRSHEPDENDTSDYDLVPDTTHLDSSCHVRLGYQKVSHSLYHE